MEPADAGPVGALRVIAWVSLVGGIIGAIVLWSNAGETGATDAYFAEIEEETDPFVVAMGFFVLLQGVLTWAALMVFGSIGENVAVLAENSASARRAASKAASRVSGMP